jgi:hypothetical protein
MAVFDILMIDDDAGNFHMLKNFAASRGVVLLYARTLEDGIQMLLSNDRIMAIILDGKGLILRDTYSSRANTGFVHEAMTQIALLEAKRNKVYPKCVLTAWYDHLKESLEGRIEVFDKKKLALDESLKSQLFDYLIVQSRDSLEYSVRQKFRQELEKMDEPYFPVSCENKLFQVLHKMERGDARQDDFNVIRDLYENLLKGINKRSKQLLPDKLFHIDGRPNLEWTLRYLGGWEVKDKSGLQIFPANPTGGLIPAHVHDCAFFIKEITSAYSHATDSPVSHYSYKASIYALLELVSWYVSWWDGVQEV